jgi:hypothetical protein
MSKEGSLATHPIPGFDSNDMACGKSPCIESPSHPRLNN